MNKPYCDTCGYKMTGNGSAVPYQCLRPECVLDRLMEAEAVISKVCECIQRNDDWKDSTKETVRNIKQALACEPQNEILDIPYDRIDGGELDLYGKGEPKTVDQLRVSAMLAEIKRLYVYKPDEIVERANEGWVSMPDFVSYDDLQAIRNPRLGARGNDA